MAESCVHCRTLCRERAELAAARKEEAAKRVAAMTTEEALVFRAERRKKREVHILVVVFCMITGVQKGLLGLNSCHMWRPAALLRSQYSIKQHVVQPMLTSPESVEGTC